MHGAEPVHPGRRPAAPADRSYQFGEDIEPVFKAPLGHRLQNAKQLGFAHALDDIVGYAAVLLSLLCTTTNSVSDRASAR